MPRYRIWYKGYYHEHSEFGHDDIDAQSEDEALHTFFKERIESTDFLDKYDGELPEVIEDLVPEKVGSWWEGDWLVS